MLITDRHRFPTPEAGEVLAAAERTAVESAIASGAGVVQLREKDLDGDALLARADVLRGICHRHGAKLVVNDRVDVARMAAADGVHLPASGLGVKEARALLPPGALVGCSAHSDAEIDAAADADYLIFGPVYETPSKRGFGPPQGPDKLRRAVARAVVPVLAVGGIDPAGCPAVAEAGAAGVAAIRCLLDAPEQAAVMAGAFAQP